VRVDVLSTEDADCGVKSTTPTSTMHGDGPLLKSEAIVAALLLTACAAAAPSRAPSTCTSLPSAVRSSTTEPARATRDCWISWPTERFQSLPAVPDVLVDELVRFAVSERPASERFAAATGVYLADYEHKELEDLQPRCDRLARVDQVLSALPQNSFMYDRGQCLARDVADRGGDGPAPTVHSTVAIDLAHRELRLGQLSYEGRRVLLEALLGLPGSIVDWAGEARAWDLIEAAAVHPAWLSRRGAIDEIWSFRQNLSAMSLWSDRDRWRSFLFSPALAQDIVKLEPLGDLPEACPARLWWDLATAYYACNVTALKQHSPWCSLRFSWKGADAPELAGDRKRGVWWTLSAAPVGTGDQTARCGERLAQSAWHKGAGTTADLIYEATLSLAWPEGSGDPLLGRLADTEERLQVQFNERPNHLLYAALASDATNREARRKWLPTAIRRELAGAVDTPYWTLLAAALGRHRDDVPLMLEWLGSDDGLERRMAIDALIVH
jgi:hypothetical protein